MTDAEVAEYAAKITSILATLCDPVKSAQIYPTATELAEELIPGRPENVQIINCVAALRLRHMTLTNFRDAMVRWETAWRKMAKTDARQQMREDREAAYLAELGGIPTDERSFVALYMAHKGHQMLYDRSFNNADGPVLSTDITDDIHLTASSLRLTGKGGLLNDRNLDRAFDQWQSTQRELRRRAVMAQIETLPATITRDSVWREWRAVCEVMFVNPEFDGAAVCKHIWQTKKTLFGVRHEIKAHHCLVVLGGQNAGKTWLGRKLQEPVAELSIETTLPDLLDMRQMDMPQAFSVFLDEFSFADRAEAAALKSLITGTVSTRRPMNTNKGQKVPINCTLHGNTNKGLGALIFDSSGMRRFIEVQVKTRTEIEPHWQIVANFDWLQLWQAVDLAAADPMEPFADRLRDIQEEIRNPDNVELWLTEFEFNPTIHSCKGNTTSHEQVEFFSADLYDHFRSWEKQYDPAYRGTSLNRWGREMKSLIDQKRVADWYRRQVGNKQVYGQKRKPKPPSGAIIPMRQF